ncbi:MAG: FAD-binding protein [Clostridia bacterium]|nr:FAD-binding protein [Clostridia bacterium]
MENYNFSRNVQENYNLTKKHLFKKKAGNAKFYYELKNDESLDNDLKEITKLYQNDIPFRIYGMHTNLYITANGYDGWFIDIGPKMSYLRFDEDTEEFICSGNLLTSQLVNYAMEKGYDFASLAGVPGMVGAGVVGNASFATGKEFGDYVKRVTLFDFESGKDVDIIPDKDFFWTRNSFIKKANKDKVRYFVKEVVLWSEQIGKKAVRAKFDAQMDLRIKDLRIGYLEGCAGSIWSNIDLRNKIGMSFRKVVIGTNEFNVDFNGARYSKYGSRFFTLDENTTEKDVAKLMQYTVDKMKELYHVELEKEVVFLDYDGEVDLYTYIDRYLDK